MLARSFLIVNTFCTSCLLYTQGEIHRATRGMRNSTRSHHRNRQGAVCQCCGRIVSEKGRYIPVFHSLICCCCVSCLISAPPCLIDSPFSPFALRFIMHAAVCFMALTGFIIQRVMAACQPKSEEGVPVEGKAASTYLPPPPEPPLPVKQISDGQSSGESV